MSEVDISDVYTDKNSSYSYLYNRDEQDWMMPDRSLFDGEFFDKDHNIENPKSLPINSNGDVNFQVLFRNAYHHLCVDVTHDLIKGEETFGRISGDKDRIFKIHLFFKYVDDIKKHIRESSEDIKLDPSIADINEIERSFKNLTGTSSRIMDNFNVIGKSKSETQLTQIFGIIFPSFG